MSIDLSIVIVNWNTKQLLLDCLQSVVNNLHDINIEVLIVDNGSTDGSATMVHEQFPQFNVIENQENIGYAKANNQAIRICHGRYLLLLNSDAVLTKGSIQRMIRVLDDDQSIGIAGARLEYPDGRSQVSHGPLPTYRTEVLSLFGLDKVRTVTGNKLEYEKTGTVSGACMLIRKTLLDQIGLLDEAFFMFSEEVDLCNRCHKAGAKVVFVNSAKVIHRGGGSTSSADQRVLRLYMGKLLYFQKHFGQNTRHRLEVMMIVSAKLKGIIYRILRIVSLGRIRKDELWFGVSRGLVDLSG